MGVFDGSVKIKRMVTDPGTDDTLPRSGSLLWGGITGGSGLAGTNGADAKLVHGDRWEQVDGSLTETTNVNVSTMILGNETRQVTGTRTLTSIGNVTHTMVSNVNETVVGSTVRTNIGAAAHTYISNHVQTHCSPQNVNEPGVFMHFISQHFGNLIDSSNVAVSYKQVYLFYFTLTPVYINVTPVLNFAAIGFNIHFEAFDNGNRALEVKLRGMEQGVEALRGYVEAVNWMTSIDIAVLKLAVNSFAM